MHPVIQIMPLWYLHASFPLLLCCLEQMLSVVTMVVAFMAITGPAKTVGVEVVMPTAGSKPHQSPERIAGVSDPLHRTVGGLRRLQQFPRLRDSSESIDEDSSDSTALNDGAKEDDSSEASRPQDDSSDSGSKSRCKAIGGSIPSGNYAGLEIDDDDADKMEEFYGQARRYCDDVRPRPLCNSPSNNEWA